MDKTVLGERIRTHRKAQKLTLEKLAEKADISLIYLGEIERGVKMPSVSTFVKIINALNISSDELLYDQTQSGKNYLSNQLTEAMNDLTVEEYAAVTEVAMTTIKQIKNLRKNKLDE